jgi:Kef-type K+ transport system membrane component KefB
MALILLAFCIGCAFSAGREYECRNTLDHSPGALMALLVCAVVLGFIMIGILSPEALLID